MEGKKIGALWIKESKSGLQFFSISMGERGKEVRFVAFPNKKNKPNQPDFNIYESTPLQIKAPVIEDDLEDMRESFDEINPSDLPF